jgi:hypothetical protein
MYLVVQNNWRSGVWRYDVKYTGTAFYIGTDDEHITVMQHHNGFHHSYNERGRHITGAQHSSATTIQAIIDHINYNASSYREPKILAALQYLRGQGLA